MNLSSKLRIAVELVMLTSGITTASARELESACDRILFLGPNMSVEQSMADEFCTETAGSNSFDINKFALAAPDLPAPPASIAVGSLEHAEYFCKNAVAAEMSAVDLYNKCLAGRNQESAR